MATPPKNILVAITNQHTGYVNQAIPIIDHLIREGFTPILASDGQNIELLHKEFPFLSAIRLSTYKVNYLNGEKKKRFSNTWNALALVWHTWVEQKVIAKISHQYHIQGIISVGRFGVRSKKIPSVLVTHQLNLLKETSTELTNYIHGQFLKRFDQCWIPDAYKSPNLSGFMGHQQLSKLNLRYIGFVNRFKKIDITPTHDITIVLTAKEPFRTQMEQKLREKLSDFNGKIVLVQGKYEQEQKTTQEKNTTTHNFLLTRALQQVLNQSKIVITNADYSTVLDVARLGLPTCFIPDESESEQIYLAKRNTTQKLAPSAPLEKFTLQLLEEINSFKGFQNYYTEPNWESLFKLFEKK